MPQPEFMKTMEMKNLLIGKEFTDVFWGASCGIAPHVDIKHFVDLTSRASLPTQVAY